MRISRNSRTTGRDHPFRSRFEGGDADLFPLRQYLRCREEFVQRIIVSVVQAGFMVALVLLARTIHMAFEKHGGGAPGWVEPLSLAGVGLMAVLVVRRLVTNVRQAMELRQDMKRLKLEFEGSTDSP